MAVCPENTLFELSEMLDIALGRLVFCVLRACYKIDLVLFMVRQKKQCEMVKSDQIQTDFMLELFISDMIKNHFAVAIHKVLTCSKQEEKSMRERH